MSGEDLLRGVIVGYEAGVRVASALQPTHYKRGYHPSATCGSLGAAVGIAAMLKFSKEQLKDAFSAAAVTASGMLKVIEDGSELKPFNVGRAAQAGLSAARMGRAGFKGLDDVLGGESGFLAMMADTFTEEPLLRANGPQQDIEKVYYKPYASCRHTHAPIEAALEIQKDNKISPAEIARVEVTTYRGVLGKHDHKEVRGETSAKMSIPFSVAVALVTGNAGLDDFSESKVTDGSILDLARKVDVLGDDELSALVPDRRVAVVKIQTKAGDSFSCRVDFPKGEPENPLSDEELEDKFSGLLLFAGRSCSQVEEMVQAVKNVETNPQDLFRIL